MSQEKPKIHRTPEQIKEREEKREELRKILPVDLQLKFDQLQPGKEPWQFEGELLKRRISKDEEDQLFYEAIKSIANKDESKLKELKELKEKEKQKYITNFKIIFFYEKGFNDENSYIRRGAAQFLGELAQVAPDKALSFYERCFNDKDPDVIAGAVRSIGKLARVAPDKAAPFYERCFNDERLYIRAEAAQSLGELTQVAPDKALSFYERCFNDENPYVRKDAARSLGELAQGAPDKTIPFYERCFNDKNPSVRSGAAESLGELAQVAPDKAIPFYEQGFNDEDLVVRVRTAESLGALAQVALDKALAFYEQCFNDENSDVRISAVRSLGKLAQVAPNQAIHFYEQCFNDKDPYVRAKTAESLGELAQVAPDKVLAFYEQGFNDKNPSVRRGAAESLGKLAQVAPDNALAFYEKGFNDENPYVRIFAAESLGQLAQVAPDKATPFYEQCFNDKDPDVRVKVAEFLGELAQVASDKALAFYEQCFNDKDPNVRADAARSLGKLAQVAPDEALAFYEKGFNDENSYVRIFAAESLGKLVQVAPDKALAFYERCFNDNNSYIRVEAARSLGGLVQVAPDKALAFYERCFNDKDPDVRVKVAEFLGELVQVAPDKAIAFYEQCFNDKDPDIRKGAIRSLGEIASHFNYDVFKKIDAVLINDYQLKDDDLSYCYALLANLLEHKEDPAQFIKVYLPQYRFIKSYTFKINSEIRESKKWQNPEDFFKQYNYDIAHLQLIDLNLSTQLLKNHLLRGLSFTESYLQVFEPVLIHPALTQSIKEYLQSNQKLDGYNFSDLLEIAAAYLSLDNPQVFQDLLQKNLGKDFSELKPLLNKTLLKKLAESIQIQVEITDQDLTQWKIKYIANLITNQEFLKKESPDIQEMCNHFLKSVFENRFQDFITNLNQEDEIGQAIAQHNQKVAQFFQQNGISWEDWLHFKEMVMMEVGTVNKMDREALFRQFENRFKAWQSDINKYEPQLKSSLAKDLAQLNQKKKEFDPSKINLDDPHWIGQLLPTYAKSLHYLQTKNPNYTLHPKALESFNHLIETIRVLTTQQQKEQTNKKEFFVKLWDRDPRKDLFQGNYTHCCIAVGVKEAPPGANTYPTLYPETIFQYLIDQGINVAEIVDPDTGDVVAQTWTFVTLDENERPVLVADNFEVNNHYPAGHNVNRAIRESMFQFLNRYAESCHISKVVLGEVGTNDVETEDLKTIPLPPIQKLGGYFNDDKYYLETLGHKKAWDIKKKIKEEIGKKQYRIEMIKEINQSILEDILKIETASFPEEMQSDLEDLKETIQNKDGVQLIARDKKGNIVSYLSSKPLVAAYKELSDYDNGLKPEKDVLYVESIATDPAARNIEGFIEILRVLREEAKQKGYKKISAHVRVTNGLSEIMQRRGAKKLRTIENWHDFGEPFDYLELEI